MVHFMVDNYMELYKKKEQDIGHEIENYDKPILALYTETKTLCG